MTKRNNPAMYYWLPGVLMTFIAHGPIQSSDEAVLSWQELCSRIWWEFVIFQDICVICNLLFFLSVTLLGSRCKIVFTD